MLTYLLQVTLCWGLFALLYALTLRRETFFHHNRAYLLLTPALSLVLPLAGGWFPATGRVAADPALALPAVTVGFRQIERVVVAWSWSGLIGWMYWSGVSLTLARMLWGIGRLAVLAWQSPAEHLQDGCLLIRRTDIHLPFSFFRWVFIPKNLDTHGEFQTMLAHERAHARGWHSLDVVLMEILCVVFWFHPLAHWYRKSLRSVHEYLADAEASCTTDRKHYGLLLLQHAQAGIAFANHFFQSPLKQRLLMLTKKASPQVRAWKYGLALPLVFLLWACTRQGAAEQEDPAGPEKSLEHNNVDKQPEFPGGSAALIQFLAKNIQYPAAARREKAGGMAVLQLVVDRNGTVTQVEPLGVANEKVNNRQDLVEEAIRVVRTMPAWSPGYKNGVPVSCKMTLPIRFKLE